uniref:Exocyst subunit Exo70 family protein n=1 Tax=Anthurium amnicola TaxID=1678845 RepID=A0A1D1Z182_9ARAE
MEDCKSVAAKCREGEGVEVHKQNAKSSDSNEKLTNDMIDAISDLGNQFCKINLAETRGSNDIEAWLDSMQHKVLSWDPFVSMIWDSESVEVCEYLHVVDEVRRFTRNVETLQLKNVDLQKYEPLQHAHSILQMAMARLEEEFIQCLVQHQQPLELDHTSFRSMEEDIMDDYSNSSFDDESVEAKPQRSSSKSSEEFVIDLIQPNAVADLKRIADVMFMCNYEKECCHAYVSARKIALDECLSVLHVEKLSIEEILRMGSSLLSTKVKRWSRAMKVFFRVYLASERHLCDHIFGDFAGSVSKTCFIEASKGSVFHLLNFGEAVAIGPPLPEKLFYVLDMYEGLTDLLPDIEDLFPEISGSCILTDCHEVLRRLGQSIKGSFNEFKKAIRDKTSTIPFAGGGTHHLTKYVMNYIKLVADYRVTLNLLLEHHDEREAVTFSEEICELGSSFSLSPLGHNLVSIASVLETNLGCRSMLYGDASLQHFFMMNNIFYMVKKVKESDLRALLGDDWLRAHNGKFRQHALNYERASWNPALSFLKDEGICSPGSSYPSKTVLKERFKTFNLAFEEIYKTQTAWLIPDEQLREDLRISISLKVLQAYRTFTGRYLVHLDSVRNRGKYVKFCPDDLQNYILDLFEGSAKSLHFSWRR